MVNPVPITLAADQNYIQHTAVTMASILANNTSGRLTFHLLTIGLDTGAQDRIMALKRIQDCDIHIHDMAEVDIGVCPIMYSHYTDVVFYRMTMASLLPSHVTKTLYLDSDIIVTRDLGALYDTDLTGCDAAVVEEPDTPEIVARKARLGTPPGHRYFNSGVMLVNLQAWRAHDIETKLFAFKDANLDKLEYMDQCVLNAVLANRVKYIHPMYNFNGVFFYGAFNHLYGHTSVADIAHAKRHFAIRHYTSRVKPWRYTNRQPHAHLYMRYIKLTPWAGYRYPDKSIANGARKYASLIHNRSRKAWLAVKNLAGL